MNADLISKKIISFPLFLKLKNVVENNSYHANEAVYNHLIKTFEKAKIEIDGNQITNTEAKEKYNEFLEQEVGGVKKRELIQILALIHDIGKMTSFDDNGQTKPMVIKLEDGNTQAPGHEYAGSVIAGQVLENTGLSKEAIQYLAKGIRLHDSFNGYFQQDKLVDVQTFINSMKQRSEGMHVEVTFNALCDNYTAPPFKPALELIKEMFSTPSFYLSREYFIK